MNIVSAQRAPPVLIDCIGYQRITWINPLPRPGAATLCWTVQLKMATTVALYSDLPAREGSLTQNANALIVERLPAPELVGRAQDPQAIICMKMITHCG